MLMAAISDAMDTVSGKLCFDCLFNLLYYISFVRSRQEFHLYVYFLKQKLTFCLHSPTSGSAFFNFPFFHQLSQDLVRVIFEGQICGRKIAIFQSLFLSNFNNGQVRKQRARNFSLPGKYYNSTSFITVPRCSLAQGAPPSWGKKLTMKYFFVIRLCYLRAISSYRGDYNDEVACTYWQCLRRAFLNCKTLYYA